jgi:hypothetical protein
VDRILVNVYLASHQNIDVLGFKYVILSLNNHQNLFEFCFPDVEEQLTSSNEVSKVDLVNFCKSTINLVNIEASYHIFLIRQKITGNYFSVCEENIAIITTDKWEKYFSPPSVFEYIIDSMIANILVMNSENDILFHSNTFGCIWDYKRLKSQIRANIILGYICDHDKNKIIRKYGEEYFNQIQNIVSQKWFGEIKNRGDIAYNLKHCFKIDINKDSGFKKSFWEKTKDKFVELSFSIVILILTAIISIITSYIVYHFLGIK